LKKLSNIIFILSLLSSGYWLSSRFIDFSQTAVLSAFSEILWLPMLGLLFFIPVLSPVFWIKAKLSIKSLYLYATLLNLLTIVFMFAGE